MTNRVTPIADNTNIKVKCFGENKMNDVLEMEWMEWLAIVEAFDSQTKQVFNECDELEEELEK